MAKAEATDLQAQAVQSLLDTLTPKRKAELIDRNDKLRMQFLAANKIAAVKAREPQLNTFLSNVLGGGDKKIRDLVFSTWLKDNQEGLGEIPTFPERFKRDADPGDEESAEADLKDATASFKNWVKTAGVDLVNVYARLGPFEFPAKALTSVKKPKPKAATAEEGEGAEATAAPAANDAALASLRAELESQKAAYEAKLARADEETVKFKRLLEENKDKRKAELNEVQEKAKAEIAAKQADASRLETALRKEIADLKKSVQDQSDKTGKVRDELTPLRQQLDRAEKDAKRAQARLVESTEAQAALEGEARTLKDRIKALEASQQKLVTKERLLDRFEKQGAAVALTSTDNLKIWEEALAEKEVKEAFTKTFNLDTIAVSHYEYDERDLQQVWKELLAAEGDLVDRFFALPFNDLEHPSETFRDTITEFIDLKDSLVAREQLAHLINFVGNRFLEGIKQTV